jgi:hypothetical protein
MATEMLVGARGFAREIVEGAGGGEFAQRVLDELARRSRPQKQRQMRGIAVLRERFDQLRYDTHRKKMTPG